jgi:anti-repressor protein
MDVAETLGYADTDDAIRRHCKLPKLFKPGEMPGLECGPRGMKFIPEPDIYRLIVHSKLPAAAQFEAWIFTEVLPAIRKTGGYITADVNDTNEEILARALMVAQETLERRDEKIRRLKIQNATMRPKALFADAVASSETSILVGEMAKILKQNGVEKMGQNRLFVWLRENGYLIRRKGTDYNMPTQKSMDLKLFEIKERTVGKIGAPARIIKTPKITGKGQQYLTRLFLSDKAA